MRTFEQFYTDANIENVNTITIQDGTTGAAKTITDPQQIEAFLQRTNDVVFTRQKDQKIREGWRYHVTFSDGDKAFLFTTDDIDDTYYDTTPDMLEIIDYYYKQHD